MAENSTAKRTRVRKLKKFFKWSFLILVGASLAAYSYVRLDVLSHANRLDVQMEEARSLGIPLTPEAIDRRAKIPRSDNAAFAYAAARKHYEENPVSKHWAGIATRFLLESDQMVRAKSRELFSRMEPNLAAYRAASRIPRCALDIDWDRFEGFGVVEWTNLKDPAKWLASDASMAALDGDWDRALEDLRAVGAIGGHIGQDQLMLSAIVQVAIQAIGYSAIEHVAWIARDNPIALSRLREVTETFPDIQPIEYIFKGEAFYSYWIDRNLSRYWDYLQNQEESEFDDAYGPELHQFEVFPPLIERTLMERAYASQSLTYWNKILRIAKDQKMTNIHLTKEMERLTAEIDNKSKPWMRFNATYLPVFASIGQAFDRLLATKRCTSALIQTIAWKNRTGNWPKSLKEAGINEVDPFDQKPLKFMLTKAGIQVYSVGPNGKDEEGQIPFDSVPVGSPRSDDVAASFPYRSYGNSRTLANERKRFDEGMKKLNAESTKSLPAPSGK